MKSLSIDVGYCFAASEKVLEIYWKRLVSLRFKRSGIEYGTPFWDLAGSSLFVWSEAKSGLLSSADGLLARASARDFFKHFDFLAASLAPETQKNARPQGQGRPSEAIAV